jgi:DNA-binding response OmpR family regulator
MLRRTALIVEDDDATRGLFRLALIFEGFQVFEAADGLEALRLIEQDPPDIIILDLGLPILSGHDVAKEVTASAHTRRIPILVVTGSDADLDSLHVDCVLRKPVDLDRLVRAVHRCRPAG